MSNHANPALPVVLGRRVRYHLPYGDTPHGVIVEIQGQPTGERARPGVMQIIRPGAARFTILTFDGRKYDDCRETSIGRMGIGCIDLLDKIHGPELIAKAHQLHAERVAENARERAEAPHRLAAAQAAQEIAQAPLFYWNGMKDAKGAKLQKAWYSYGNVTGCPEGTITIYARDYARFSDLVRACFDVLNDTDTMTDYFDNDRIRVAPTHPLYAQVRKAWEAQETYRAKRRA